MVGFMGLEQEGLQCNAVQKSDSCIITTAGAIETIVEDPLLSILELDPNITQPPGQIRRPGLDDNPASPGFKLFMKNLIPDVKVSVFLDPWFPCRRILYPFLGESIQRLFSS